jgi:hypothetical protein
MFDLTKPSGAGRWAVSAAAIAHCCCWLLLLLLLLPPAGMIARNLDMMRGGNMRYQKTAAYGHFGRDDAGGLQTRVLMQQQLAWMPQFAQAMQQAQQFAPF